MYRILCLLFVAGLASTMADQRGFFDGITTDIINKYMEQLEVLKTIVAGFSSGGNPTKVIKDTILKHPNCLKNSNLFTAACALPTMKSIKYVGEVCSFIDTNADKLIAWVEGNKDTSGAVFDKLESSIKAQQAKQRGFFDGIATDIFNKYIQQLEVLKTIVTGLSSGKGVTTVIKDTLLKHPHCLKNSNMFTAACALPTMQSVQYLGEVCKFIDNNANKLIEWVEANKDNAGAIFDKIEAAVKLQQGKRGFFDSITTDIINKYMEQVEVLKTIVSGLSSGGSPTKVIKETLLKHPNCLKNTNLFTAACALPTMKSIKYVGEVCSFIDTNADKLIAWVEGNKDTSSAMFDKLESSIKAQQAKQRGFFDGLATDIFNKYMEQLEVLKTIVSGLQSGGSPTKVIKETLLKHPNCLKNTNLFTAACALPTMKSVKYVGEVCSFIDTNADKLINWVEGNKDTSSAMFDKLESSIKAQQAKQRGFFDGITTDIINKYMEQLEVLKTIVAGFSSGGNPTKVIKDTILKHPNCLKNSNLFTAACALPTMKSVKYVGDFCTFIDENANKLIDWVEGNKNLSSSVFDKIENAVKLQQAKQRGFFDGLATDIFNKYMEQLEVLKTIVSGLQSGGSPTKVIKETLLKHPNCLKNTNLFTAACALPTMKSVKYVGEVCSFIDTNADKLINWVEGNKETSGAVFDKLENAIKVQQGKQ